MSHKTIIALTLALCAVVTPTASAKSFPEVIPLPTGWGPEGIATGRGHSIFAGSIPTGDIWMGSLRTGQGAPYIEAPAGSSATGIKVDRRNRLFVSGGASKTIRVYDVATKAVLFDQTVGTAGFINDVVVTRRAAYFTDSGVQVLYRLPIGRNGALGPLETVPITGDLVYDTNPQTFEANGIAATRNGKRLIIVQSHTGKLFSADPATGATKEIALSGGEPVVNGDGLLLRGKRLYVARNRNDLVTRIRLSRSLARGTVTGTLTHDELNGPTTLAAHGRRLYAVNGQFFTPDDRYEIVRLPRG
jgi:sugar lactone lactonase YvrE